MTKDIIRMWFGAAVIYVAMAACSDDGASTPTPKASAGRTNSGGAGGLIAETGGTPDGTSDLGPDGIAVTDSSYGDSSLIDAAIDAISQPVPDARADTDTSGTRLKARRQVGTDGSSHFVGWYDSQLNVNCIFMTASDGVERCLPGWGVGLALVFLDAACTQPAAYLPAAYSACSLPKYLATTAAINPTCPTEPVYRYQVYPMGSVMSSPPATLYSKDNATCSAASLGGTGQIFSLGAEMNATSFIGATTVTDP